MFNRKEIIGRVNELMDENDCFLTLDEVLVELEYLEEQAQDTITEMFEMDGSTEEFRKAVKNMFIYNAAIEGVKCLQTQGMAKNLIKDDDSQFSFNTGANPYGYRQ